MKIRGIKAAGLRGDTPKGGWGNEIKPADCIHTLIAVYTDEGVTGWGSVFTNDALVVGSLGVLEPLYIEENPLDAERVSEKLHADTFWLGRDGSTTHTISAIDIAMWDILGKATGQPVGRLLGGLCRNSVRPYASLLMEEPEQLTEKLLSIREQGFQAFKIGWGPFGRGDYASDERIVRAARGDRGRGSVNGRCRSERRVLVSRLQWAKRTADMLVEYDVHWFEEPLPPDNLQDYVLLRETAPLPIAGGEVLTRRQSFEPWIQQGALDVVQPDVTKAGGLSEARRIARMEEDRGLSRLYRMGGIPLWDCLRIFNLHLQVGPPT